MRRLRLPVLVTSSAFVPCATAPDASMSQARTESLIEAASSSFEGDPGRVEFTFAG